MSTVKDMRAWVKYKIDNKIATERCAVEHFSKVWSDTCKKVGLDKRKHRYLHHTFGVMGWLRTGNIYLVCKKMGHSSVTTTEIYTKLELC